MTSFRRSNTAELLQVDGGGNPTSHFLVRFSIRAGFIPLAFFHSILRLRNTHARVTGSPRINKPLPFSIDCHHLPDYRPQDDQIPDPETRLLRNPQPPIHSSPTALSKQQLKVAYHKALLKHHPDKATSIAATPAPTHDTKTAQRPSPDRNADASPTFTIDEITAAYKTLSDPALRAEYDRVLQLERVTAGKGEKGAGAAFHTGLEVVDLEDLVCEETGDGEGQGLLCWYRGKEAEHGEVVIGCRGCSLWMKILFAMEEGDG
ncbi:uncharacterized protein P174DRAFT_421910 [Aspergillus novofumigatus IBT 16806]|uniref:J domain-containing protein n=1 Tax=Aspergillus novofumigatus (strain IBT 16806) TaxID=1392255 RepID=A0A2I1C5E5_ASPN1|nr:uncharacterized protein P174DRAFT_421910 [Aspergillus novofumigatus IBT 16806]PKX92879.1 hypothetical protein P174DRAFT_421910 [Aspergillus novofumigatus IBT 16806]